ncbi:phage baseplate assembly protein V [Morganella morganii]|uniref:Phage baseplate assembly protein V n=2 Tax=Morganella morganii TaxID=582 RepID=A0A8I0PS32_MORMO|nr:phage baseplate assembly protein V [Morganella morganii]
MNGVIFATGTVSAVDAKTVRARVRLPDHDNLRTWWLDVMQNNTYRNKDYFLPDVGEQVKVLMTPDGVEGVILGAVYSDKDPAAINNPDKRRTDFADGTYVEYDRKQNAMIIGGTIRTLTLATHSDITVQTGAQVTIIATNSATVKTQKATINAPESEITGNATINGSLLVKKGITGQGGMAISGGEGGRAVTIKGGLATTEDITVAGQSVLGHEPPRGYNNNPTGTMS